MCEFSPPLRLRGGASVERGAAARLFHGIVQARHSKSVKREKEYAK